MWITSDESDPGRLRGGRGDRRKYDIDAPGVAAGVFVGFGFVLGFGVVFFTFGFVSFSCSCSFSISFSISISICFPFAQMNKGPDARNRLQDIWIWNGRPDWDQIFTRNRDGPHSDIGVAFCGTPFIGKDLAKNF